MFAELTIGILPGVTVFLFLIVGRRMKVYAEALFSLAVPAFNWHTKVTCTPGIWIEASDTTVTMRWEKS